MFVKILYTLFIFACLYDPANKILGIKLPLFVVIFLITVVLNKKAIFPSSVLKYVVLFALVLPISSVLWGYLTNFSSYREATIIDIIKPYLFVFLSFSLINSPKTDINKIFSYCLVVLASTIIVIYTLYVSGIVPIEFFYSFGHESGLYTLGGRSYGEMEIDRVYFHTSPMLIFGSFYFLDRYFNSKKKQCLFFSLFISTAMLFSGTRNDMIMAFMPYLTYGYIKSSKTIRLIILVIACCFIVYLVQSGIVAALFDVTETSNAGKLGYVPVYLKFFSDPVTFFLGDGLGSYAYFPPDGYLNNTELTYFELIRRFGIFGALVYLVLMYGPVFKLYSVKKNRWLAFALLMYLIMVFTNPFFFSSNGMMILSIVIFTIYSSSSRNIKHATPIYEY